MVEPCKALAHPLDESLLSLGWSRHYCHNLNFPCGGSAQSAKEAGKGLSFLLVCLPFPAPILISAPSLGEHPRMGALDVCPFVPVMNVSMEECVTCAHVFGQRLAAELGVPGELGPGTSACPIPTRMLPAVEKMYTFCKSFTKWRLLPNRQNQIPLGDVPPAPARQCSPPALSCSLPVRRGGAGGEQESPARHPCWRVRGTSREGEPGSTWLGVMGWVEPSCTSPALGAGIVALHQEKLMKHFGCC